MINRMKWFKCIECGLEYEDIVDRDDLTSPECESCQTKDVPILDDFVRQIHNEHGKYKHVSWSSWAVGN